jgi:hypothetical protein
MPLTLGFAGSAHRAERIAKLLFIAPAKAAPHPLDAWAH